VRSVEQHTKSAGRIHIGVRIGQVGLVAVIDVARDLRDHRPLDDSRGTQERPDFQALDSSVHGNESPARARGTRPGH
jgi:hypothetical protein